MAQDDDFFAIIEPLHDLAGEYCLARTGRCFQDKAVMLFDDRRVTIDQFLLPISQKSGTHFEFAQHDL